VRNLSIKKAAEEEKQFSVEHGQTNGLTVSGDGSWRKRGFSSLFGLVSLIGWFSKKVLDVSVKSKYCKACEHWKKKEGTVEYEEWAEAHKSACHAMKARREKWRWTLSWPCSNAPRLYTTSNTLVMSVTGIRKPTKV